jgi:hypothetical protein
MLCKLILRLLHLAAVFLLAPGMGLASYSGKGNVHFSYFRWWRRRRLKSVDAGKRCSTVLTSAASCIVVASNDAKFTMNL